MSKKPSTKKKKKQHDEFANSSCKFRVYVNSQQHALLGHYLYWVQKFRNEVVVFCNERRKARGIWMHQNPELVAKWNALGAEQLFSKYRVLSNEEVIAFNDDVKKYGTRAQIQKWKGHLHCVRETPLGLMRQYMIEDIKTELQEQKYHHNTLVKNMIDELLADDIQVEIDELVVSQNVKRSMQ